VATPSQPQQRPAAGPTAASQAGQGTTSPRRGKGTNPLLVGGFAGSSAHSSLTHRRVLQRAQRHRRRCPRNE
jgi:hypothetical protein